MGTRFMNKLYGHISGILSNGDLSLVTVALPGGTLLEVMVIDTPKTGNYLENGREVAVLFKETEVIITTETTPQISIQNRIPCKIKAIEKGQLLSRLHLEAGTASISALLPTSVTWQMALHPGTPVLALIKYNEIMLSAP